MTYSSNEEKYESVRGQMQASGEEYRSLVEDYQSVFGTPAGERVLNHLLDNVLRDRIPGLAKGIPLTSEWAVYSLALSDVAKHLKNIMNYDFRVKRAPVVHHRRPPR